MISRFLLILCKFLPFLASPFQTVSFNLVTIKYLEDVKDYFAVPHLEFHSTTNDEGVVKKKQAGGMYRGKPWITDRTIDVVTVAETPFARCDYHTVQSEDGLKEQDHWLFLEEMDAVNVLVEHNNQFLFFEQKKYAIPGVTYAPVGGFIEHYESPWEAARREVKEELGLGSPVTHKKITVGNPAGNMDVDDVEDRFKRIPKLAKVLDEHGVALGNVSDEEQDHWVFLGRYRTAANRGGGFIYTYLLKHAVPILPNGGTSQFRPSGDDESQVLLRLNQKETMDFLSSGQFQEVKWAATIGLAMLHLQLGMPGVPNTQLLPKEILQQREQQLQQSNK